MTWTGFVLINKEGSAYFHTLRNCALQSYQEGLDGEIFKDSRDAAKKGIVIAYVQINRIDH